MEPIVFDGNNTYDALERIDIQIFNLYTLGYVKDIYYNSTDFEKLNLDDRAGGEQFSKRFIENVSEIIKSFRDGIKGTAQKKRIQNSLKNIIQRCDMRQTQFDLCLKDDYNEPFTNEKFWSADNDDLKYYCIVHSTNLEKLPFILEELSKTVKIDSKVSKPLETIQSDNKLTIRQTLIIFRLLKKFGLFKKDIEKAAEKRFLSQLTGFSASSFIESYNDGNTVDAIIDLAADKDKMKVLKDYLIPIEKIIRDFHHEELTDYFNKLVKHYK